MTFWVPSSARQRLDLAVLAAFEELELVEVGTVLGEVAERELPVLLE